NDHRVHFDESLNNTFCDSAGEAESIASTSSSSTGINRLQVANAASSTYPLRFNDDDATSTQL
ncbi:hypothetical protein Ciccas_008543, partial [Cichlidogyrus casuarinus]